MTLYVVVPGGAVMCMGNAMAWTVLLRLAYLGVANVFALLRLLTMSNLWGSEIRFGCPAGS